MENGLCGFWKTTQPLLYEYRESNGDTDNSSGPAQKAFDRIRTEDLWLDFPPFRGRFTAWDSSRALRWLRVRC